MVEAILGIDMGGTGIKGALVDPAGGGLVTGRLRLNTPKPATPAACAEVVGRVAAELGGSGPVGCTVPGVVRHGIVHSAANIDGSWIGVDAVALFGEATGREVVVLNDADAAGLAEVRFGAAAGRSGTVAILTFGTGIGSALFRDGVLLPNTELGHIEFHGDAAERFISGKLRSELDWAEWSHRAESYLRHVAFVLGVDLVVFGGGISKEWSEFAHLLRPGVELVRAELLNNAGIVGAAIAASEGWHA